MLIPALGYFTQTPLSVTNSVFERERWGWGLTYNSISHTILDIIYEIYVIAYGISPYSYFF